MIPHFLLPIGVLLLCEFTKYIIAEGKKTFFRSGGMPSSHSAVMASAVTVVFFLEGMHSSVFVVACAVAYIVWYDAVKVRSRIGNLGKKVNELSGNNDLDEVVGHSVAEVVVGIAFGIIVTYLLLLL